MLNNIHVLKPGGDALENASKFILLRDNFLKYTDPSHQFIFVCSAVKSCTRTLVDLFKAKQSKNRAIITQKFEELREMHEKILRDLFPSGKENIWTVYHEYMLQLNKCLNSFITYSYEEEYGYILKFGELISSRAFSSFLNDNGVRNQWIDSRSYVKSTYTNPPKIMEGVSEKLMQNLIPILKKGRIIVKPGFICSDYHTGRDAVMEFDSSDTSATFVGHALNAKSITLLKKVKGIIRFDNDIDNPNAEILLEMTYGDAYSRFKGSELYPAHPDAIEIASRKEIPLYLKSYEDWSYPGTLIHG